MIFLLWTYLIWLTPHNPSTIGFKYRIDCEQAQRIDRQSLPTSRCFKNNKRHE